MWFMADRAIRKTISLPEELARELQKQARTERKTLSHVIQEALLTAKRERLKNEFGELQTYWSKKAVEKGILSEKDLERYLRK
jgi:predicted CopG family antitoxin